MSKREGQTRGRPERGLSFLQHLACAVAVYSVYFCVCHRGVVLYCRSSEAQTDGGRRGRTPFDFVRGQLTVGKFNRPPFFHSSL